MVCDDLDDTVASALDGTLGEFNQDLKTDIRSHVSSLDYSLVTVHFFGGGGSGIAFLRTIYC